MVVDDDRENGPLDLAADREGDAEPAADTEGDAEPAADREGDAEPAAPEAEADAHAPVAGRPPDPVSVISPVPGHHRRRRHDTLRGIPIQRNLRRRVRDYVRNVEEMAVDSSRRRVMYPVFVLRVVIQVLRQWARDRCPQQAASLAFQTVLSVVPLLAVMLAALRATGSLGQESKLTEFLAQNLIPIPQQEISQRLLELSQNITFQSMGAIGLATSVILAFIMINSLERIASYIWRAEHKRSLGQKFVVFYATATVGPALLATGLYQAAKVGLTEGMIGYALSFTTTLVASFLANYFLPSCRVRWRPALAGALVLTLLFEIAKFGFKIYVTEFALERYAGIYGAIAVLPLWLVWIYYSWLTLLLGFEVAHAGQNLHLLEQVDHRGTISLENELIQRVNGVVAARVMVAIARAYVDGEKVLSRRALEQRFDLSDEVITRLSQRLKEHDLLIEVSGDVNGFLPARPPSEISLAHVIRAFRGSDVVEASTAIGSHTALDKVLADIEADTLQRTGDLYLDELL